MTEQRQFRQSAAPLLLLALAGCGGGSASKPPLTITPSSATAAPGDAPLTFTATLSGLSGPVDWRMSPALAGRLSAAADSCLSVQYTPPNEVGAATTVVLTASVGDTTQSIAISLSALPQFYADPSAGLDTNPGTQASPLRTVHEALSRMAGPTKTTVLLPGTYHEGTGELWDYAVPAGATLKGSAPGVVLQASNHKKGLVLSADTSVSDLTMTGFSTALEAALGKQSLTRVTFSGNLVDLHLASSASATLQDCSSEGAKQQSILTEEASRVDVRGGTFGKSDRLVDARGSSALYVTDADLSGGLLMIDDSSALFLSNVRAKAMKTSAVYAGPAAQLVVMDSTFSDTSASNSIIVTLGTATIDRTTFDNAFTAITAGGFLTLRNSRITNCTGAPVDLMAGTAVMMRNTAITANRAGLSVRDATGGIDLGTPNDPGGNTLKGNLPCNLKVDGSPATVQAAGNTWDADQGASDQGQYTSALVEASTGDISGRNFELAKGTSLRL